jgi:hypothetical protein
MRCAPGAHRGRGASVRGHLVSGVTAGWPKNELGGVPNRARDAAVRATQNSPPVSVLRRPSRRGPSPISRSDASRRVASTRPAASARGSAPTNSASSRTLARLASCATRACSNSADPSDPSGPSASDPGRQACDRATRILPRPPSSASRSRRALADRAPRPPFADNRSGDGAFGPSLASSLLPRDIDTLTNPFYSAPQQPLVICETQPIKHSGARPGVCPPYTPTPRRRAGSSFLTPSSHGYLAPGAIVFTSSSRPERRWAS